MDLIVTKSVSRFARNTVDSLTTIRQLKEKGIEVYFEKENIWTFDGKGELLLTIMSSLAQEESRSISENCTWGQRKRFADGKVTVPFNRFLGYDRGPDGNLVVNREQAVIVQRIYAMFLQGMSYHGIAKQLTADGIPTPGGKDKWSISTIRSILSNEKYKGDALLQKTYIADPISHKSVPNRGVLPQFYVENVLPAIISREEWQAAQELRKRHSGNGLKQSESYPFTNMLVCPYCGKRYRNYTSAGYNRELINWYRCQSRRDHTAVEVPGMMYTPPSRLRVANPSPAMVAYREKYNHPTPTRQMVCSDIRLPFEYPKRVFVRAWNQLVSRKTRYQPILQRTVETTDNALTRLRAREMIELLDTVGRLADFDYALMLRTLDYIEVYSEDKMSVVFQSGVRITQNQQHQK